MASTPEGTRLTEAHRQAQQDVRDDFLAEFLALWALLDTDRLDETGPGWLQAVTRAIVAYRLLSAEVATRYFWQFAAAEAPDPVPRPRIPDLDVPAPAPRPSSPRPGRSSRRTPRPSRQANDRRARRDLDRALEDSGIRWDFDESSLVLPERRTTIEIPDIDWKPQDRKVTIDLNIAGPIGQKSQIKKGRSPERARDVSFVESSGAATRHVLTGGRQSLLTLVQENMPDPRWVRVTDGDPCAFCAMLASRGPVYLTKDTAEFSAHNHCACTAEPVYFSNAPWPGRAAEFRRLWRQHIENRYSGKEARRQWRRIYTQMQREQRETA